MLNALLLAATLTLDAPIEQAMRDTGATRLAVAVVQNDKIVFLDQEPAQVDAKTPLALTSAKEGS